MYFSSGNIFIQMEKDFHIPILPGSWAFNLVYRKAKIIVIPFFFSLQKKHNQTHSSVQGQRCHFLLCIENEEPFPFDFICSDKIKTA